MPGNYLKDLQTPPKNNEVEVFAADEEDMKQADAIIHSKVCLLILSLPCPSSHDVIGSLLLY